MVEQKRDGVKIKDSAGRNHLVRWLSEHKVSKNAFASRVLVSPQAVTGWLDGLTQPDGHRRELIKIVTGIETSAWDLQEDIERRREELARVTAFVRDEQNKGAA
jgi:hypothetical protein